MPSYGICEMVESGGPVPATRAAPGEADVSRWPGHRHGLGKGIEMPKASRETASEHAGGQDFEARSERFDGGFTVTFETFAEDADLTPLLQGLPDDRCPVPHWGYVVKGKLTYIGQTEEAIEGGEAFYVPAGHTLTAEAGTDVIFFSPTDEWQQTVDVVGRNRERAARAGVTVG